jgi:hypothetical protein
MVGLFLSSHHLITKEEEKTPTSNTPQNGKLEFLFDQL